MTMWIAEVIVDVSTFHVDRPFDYAVPDDWIDIIEVGSRVKVPFGSRNVLGFVVHLKQQTTIDNNKLRAISQLLDMEPVLTTEMVTLAKWLKEQTICFEIDALQVMLPSALRAKYEKYVYLEGDVTSLEASIQPFFTKSYQVNMKVLEKEGLLRAVKLAVKAGKLKIHYVVKQQGQVKAIRKVQIIENMDMLQHIAQQLHSRALKQKQLVEWMIQYSGKTVLPEEILQQANVTNSVLQSVIEKGAAHYIYEEVYRDPFTKEVTPTAPLPLTTEQAIALQHIKNCIDRQQPETFLLQGVTGSGKTEVYLQTIQKC